MRSRPSRCSRSKKNGVSGTSGVSWPGAASVPARLAVTWKGRARRAGSSAMASPSRTRAPAGLARTARVISGSRGVIIQGPGKHPDLAALPVHLDPDAVDLPFDRGRGHPLERGRHGRRGSGQHRPQRPSHLKPEGPERREGGLCGRISGGGGCPAMLWSGLAWSFPARPPRRAPRTGPPPRPWAVNRRAGGPGVPPRRAPRRPARRPRPSRLPGRPGAVRRRAAGTGRTARPG